LASASARSALQAGSHRRALGQVTALHGFFLLVGQGTGRRWTATSWVLSALHLGMLESRSNLGAANTLTLVRANLPALGRSRATSLALVALATDATDGRLARRSDTTTAFGLYADALADAAFWTWLTSGHDDERALRAAAVLVWMAPITTVTAISIGRGQMIDPPRPRLVRPAASLQIAIAVRLLHRHLTRPVCAHPIAVANRVDP
jgi:hypothetical protein